MKLWAQFRLAVMMLTRLPVGQLRYVPSMGDAAWAFPLVGAGVGGLAALVVLTPLQPHLAAGLALVVMLVITGGLHEDGLADLADGFGGGRDKARKLEIMRDSRIGSYGTLALIMALGLRVQAMALVAPHRAALALIAIEAASRAGLPLVLRLMPPARAEGLGHAAAGVSAASALVALAIGAAALAVLGTAGLVLAAVMAISGAALAWLAMRQIGGQTGDVLGAMQQITALSAWLALTLV